MHKKFKVLYFIDFGGMAHYTAMLANTISKRINVTIIGQREIALDYINHNIEIKKVLKYPIGLDIRNLILFKNVFIINTIKPDLIHITTPYPIVNAVVRFFFAHKYPLVVTVHDARSHSGEVKSNWRALFVDFFQMLLMKKANKIIVHNGKLKEELITRKIPSKKIAVIPHGDYSFFTKYRKNLLPEKNCILFFGRIIKYKGLEYLIKAIPLITKEIATVKLIIAGEGKFEEYEKLITENISKHIEVYNQFIPNYRVAELFERAELLILPYIDATQSGPLHIAYAFKKPVIATNVGALPEVVDSGKTGLLVPPKDVNALAEAIIKLLKDDKLRKEMGENAYRKMKEEMSWDKIAEKTIEVYKEAIELNMMYVFYKK